MIRFRGAILLLLLSLVSLAENSKILGIFPTCAFSHFTTGFALMRELAERGHEVTFINCFPQKTPIDNLHDVYSSGVLDIFKSISAELRDMENMSVFTFASFCHRMGTEMTERVFNSPAVQQLLQSDSKFDVVISEEFVTPGLLGIAAHFNAPSMLVSSLRPNIWNNYYFANPEEISYIPHIHSMFISPMNLYERAFNLLHVAYEVLHRELVMLPKQNEILHKYLPHTPDLKDIIYNQSVMLVNSHASFEYVVPALPNVIEIGGYHVRPPKPLPEDLKKFLDEAENGVVFFSLGSNLKSKELDPVKIDAIMRVISRLKEKVIWKFEVDDLPNKPQNLFIGKWFPQSDILAHPNVKVFISHGGMMSSIEAVNRGVPILGIPFFGDQKSNIRRAVHRGYALSVPYQDITEETFERALTEILNNPKYRENVKMRSRLMHDRPMSPMDTAVYWVEYVIRNKGAQLLRPMSLDLMWYQRYLLDIAILFLFAILAFCLIVRKCFKGNKADRITIKKNQ